MHPEGGVGYMLEHKKESIKNEEWCWNNEIDKGIL